jgi:hypothetical protein
VVDAEWRRLSRASSGGPEELAHQRRWAARLSGEPRPAPEPVEWREVQLAAFRMEKSALEVLAGEVLGLEGRDPRWTPLAAFLGDAIAADALGVEVTPPRRFERWVECLHYWAGGEAHLRAGVAVADAWPVLRYGFDGILDMDRVLPAARRYASSPGRRTLKLYLKEAERNLFRAPGGGVRLWHPPPASVLFLRFAINAARARGAQDRTLHATISDALLRWVRQGSSPASPPSPSIR